MNFVNDDRESRTVETGADVGITESGKGVGGDISDIEKSTRLSVASSDALEPKDRRFLMPEEHRWLYTETGFHLDYPNKVSPFPVQDYRKILERRSNIFFSIEEFEQMDGSDLAREYRQGRDFFYIDFARSFYFDRIKELLALQSMKDKAEKDIIYSHIYQKDKDRLGFDYTKIPLPEDLEEVDRLSRELSELAKKWKDADIFTIRPEVIDIFFQDTVKILCKVQHPDYNLTTILDEIKQYEEEILRQRKKAEQLYLKLKEQLSEDERKELKEGIKNAAGNDIFLGFMGVSYYVAEGTMPPEAIEIRLPDDVE